jgi:hypothetical protein
MRGSGPVPERFRETVTRHGRRVRAYRDVLAACLPELAPAPDMLAALFEQ